MRVVRPRNVASRTQFEAPDATDCLTNRRCEREIVRGSRDGHFAIARIAPQHARLPVDLPADDPVTRPFSRVAPFTRT